MSKLKITELVLRDAHQSLLATRMRTEHMLPAMDDLSKAGYYSLEAWGGATFDTCIRFLDEDPWERLRLLSEKSGNTPIQMLLRGQNLLGYRHYADDVVDKFVERSYANGVRIFRIFDAMNDLRNLERAIKAAIKTKAHVQGTLSYTTSEFHNTKLFVDYGIELEKMGCHSICIKDMAGLLLPNATRDLVKGLKKACKIPIQLHCHYTSGMASVCYATAMEEGVDGLDTAISSFSCGTGHPPTETIHFLAKEHGLDTGLDVPTLLKIAQYFRKVREEYKDLESLFSGVDPAVLTHQIPGGMISNLASQLKELNALDKMDEVMLEVAKVRADFGYPPLVTPTSQIVGTQAVFNVLVKERYKSCPEESKLYMRGKYGKPNAPISDEIRKKIIKDEPFITDRPANHIPPEWDKLSEEAKKFGATCDDDVLIYASFPKVAPTYFEKKSKGLIGLHKAEKVSIVVPETKLSADKPVAQTAPVSIGTRTFKIQVQGQQWDVTVSDTGAGIPISQTKSTGSISQPIASPKPAPEKAHVNVAPKPTPIAQQVRPPKTSGGRGKFEVEAPISGKIISFNVELGQSVQVGDVLLILDAMKMENEIVSEESGTIFKINSNVGDFVNAGDILLIIEMD